MKRLTLILFLIVQLSIVNCQLSIAQIGTWRAYMSYYEPQQIVKAGSNTLFVRASNSLYSYNLTDHSINTYNKVNTLNDTYISHIAWNQQTKRLIIVYQNGNIDRLNIKKKLKTRLVRKNRDCNCLKRLWIGVGCCSLSDKNFCAYQPYNR